MIRPAALLLALAGGCTPQPPIEDAPPPVRLTATDAVLTVADRGLVISARQASLGDDGAGTAVSVEAEAPGLSIKSELTQWDLRGHSATFTGNVRAIRRDATLRCERLMVLLGDGEQIRAATAEGAVSVVQADRRATAEHAELDGASGKIVLTGSPRLSQEGRTLSGEVITIWLDDERVDCEHCTLALAGEAIGGG
jgi:lipopolysaccharide transport protein LptA